MEDVNGPRSNSLLLKLVQLLTSVMPGGKVLEGGGGVVYTRWGRTTCPSGAQLVYEGIVGGSHYSRSGGGANYLCLPKDPDYDTSAKVRYQSFLYGAEYQFHTSLLKSKENYNPPCAVCHVPSRSSKLMIPAKTSCPSSWTKEYGGYLVAEYYTHKKNVAYECLDKDPECIPGSQKDTNGALLYFVKSTCTGFKCPPYKNGGVVTCVVCTR